MQKYGGMSTHSIMLALRAENLRSSDSLISSLALNICSYVLTMQDVFVKTKGDENNIYPPTVAEIVGAQKEILN